MADWDNENMFYGHLHPEHVFIGAVEAAVTDKRMKPAACRKRILALLDRYDQDQKRRNVAREARNVAAEITGEDLNDPPF